MKFQQQIDRTHGAFSAIFTPFDQANQINFDRLTDLVNYQVSSGIQGFFVTGSTGEGLLLTYKERLAVIKQVADCSRDRAVVIAHVGHPSTDFSTRLAIDAAAEGVDWIASVAPIYHGTTFQGAMRHYEAISNATDLPFMIYCLGGVIDPMRDKAFFDLPNVCGLKYTGANFFSVQQLERLVEQPIALMSGFDEQFVASLSFGFDGGIGTTFNFAPKIYSDIYKLYHDGNIHHAARLQSEVNRVTNLMISHENWSYRKAIMRYVGLDCGAARAPYRPLTELEYQKFASELSEIDVLQRDHGAQ